LDRPVATIRLVRRESTNAVPWVGSWWSLLDEDVAILTNDKSL